MEKNYHNQSPNLKDEEIKELKIEIKNREKTIESINQKLNNNNDILQDIITENKRLKKDIHEYDLKMVDEKLHKYQELQEDHQKILHRLQVTKDHLDDANNKNRKLREKKEEMQIVIEDLVKRGLIDYIRSRYPETYLKYKG